MVLTASAHASNGTNTSKENTKKANTPATITPDNVIATMKTNLGDIQLELFTSLAPDTVKNFIEYAESGFYNGTIFHRVIDGFMIQGGGFDQNMQRKVTRSPIINEANNGLKNTLGTIAMARTSDPHSATAQFFINVKDNPNLDFSKQSIRGWGYAVFGQVTQGMEVINRIRKTQTVNYQRYQNVPKTPITIQSVTITKKKTPQTTKNNTKQAK